MKKTILLLFLPVSLCAQTAYQDSIQKPIKYMSSIYQEVMVEFESEPDELIAVDSLIQLVISDSAWRAIDTTQHFQLLGLYDYYWEEVLGHSSQTRYSGNLRERETTKDIKPILTPFQTIHPSGSQNYFLEVHKEFPIYSGKSMVDSLYLPIRELESQADKSGGLPVIFERDALNNTRWTVFQSSDKLMLRKVHSYPHGNMTSFYSETLVFFRVL